MTDRVNQNQTYKVKGSSVYGNGHRYNLTNNVTAVELCNTLNTLIDTTKLYRNTTEQYDKITKQIIQIQMTLQVLEYEIKNLSEMVNNESND